MGTTAAGTADARTRLTPLQKKAWLLSAGGVALDGFDLFIMGVALPLLQHIDPGQPSWVTGLVSSAAIVGAIPGAMLGGLLTDRFGRKRLYMWDLVGFVAFAGLSALAWNAWSLILFRFCLGLAVGADYPISASFSAEYLPSSVRGRWLVAGFSFQAVGMIAGALTGLTLLWIHPFPDTWRLMLAIGAIPALLIIWARRGVPETPTWARHLQEAEQEERARIGELFRREHLAKTILTSGGWFLMDVMMYGIGLFTPLLLAAMAFAERDNWDFIQQDMGHTAGTAALDVFLVLGFIAAVLLVDRVGRMRLQKVGFLMAAVGMALLGLSSMHGNPMILVLIGFATFNFFINMGPNSTTFLIPAEIYPTRLRATGHGFAAGMGKFGAALGVFLFPILNAAWGDTAMVSLMAGVGVGGLLVTSVFGMETQDIAILEDRPITASNLGAALDLVPDAAP